MVVGVRGQELLLPVTVTVITVTPLSLNSFSTSSSSSSMRSTLSLFRSLALHPRRPLPSPLLPRPHQFPRLSVGAEQPLLQEELPEYEPFRFDRSSAEAERLPRPEVEVKELSDVPELWRRSRVAWLCKELPAHKAGTLVRILNAQKKWMRQEDATYVIMHCLRIRENETAFRVSSSTTESSSPFQFRLKIGIWL